MTFEDNLLQPAACMTISVGGGVQPATARSATDRAVAVVDAKIMTDDVITLLTVRARHCMPLLDNIKVS
jgi:hypothetical protein